MNNSQKFYVKEKRERKGRDPATGEDMMLAPRRGLADKYFEKYINGG